MEANSQILIQDGSEDIRSITQLDLELRFVEPVDTIPFLSGTSSSLIKWIGVCVDCDFNNDRDNPSDECGSVNKRWNNLLLLIHQHTDSSVIAGVAGLDVLRWMRSGQRASSIWNVGSVWSGSDCIHCDVVDKREGVVSTSTQLTF